MIFQKILCVISIFNDSDIHTITVGGDRGVPELPAKLAVYYFFSGMESGN